jgi:hypothetical protein
MILSSTMFRTILLSMALCLGGSLWSSQHAHAQATSQSSRSLGMGGTGTAFISGYQANTVNPANLLLMDGQPSLSLGILGGLRISGGGSLLKTDVYETYLTTGKTITGTVASDMLNEMFGSNSLNTNYVGFGVDVTSLGVGLRRNKWAYGATFRTRVKGRTDISRGLTELAIYGLDPQHFSEPTPVNFDVEGNAFHELSIAVARQVIQLDHFLGFRNIRVLAGASPKLLLGTHLSSIDFNSDFKMKGDSLVNHKFSYTLQTTGGTAESLKEYARDRQNDALGDKSLGDYLQDPSGSDFYGLQGFGYGIDLGATVEMDIPSIGLGFFNRADVKKLRVSLALTDLGSVVYNKQVGEFKASGELNWEGLDVNEDDLDQNYDGKLGDYAEHVLVDSLLEGKYTDFTTTDVSSLSSPLPARATLGAQLQLDRFSFATDIGMGFNEIGMNSQKLNIALGTEYKFFGFLPVRLGLRTGGELSTRYSAGTGLDFKHFTWDFGVMASNYGAKKGANFSFAWSGLQIRF